MRNPYLIALSEPEPGRWQASCRFGDWVSVWHLDRAKAAEDGDTHAQFGHPWPPVDGETNE